jgi:hypothetical protein
MLAKEKRRAAWSLAIGAIISVAYFGWCYVGSSVIETRLHKLVRQCEQRPIRQKFKSYDEIDKTFRASSEFQKLDAEGQDEALETVHERYSCDPSELSIADGLKDTQAEIADAQREADHEFDSLWIFSGLGFLIFCLPLLWYLLLDRIREVGDAMSGRRP